MFLLISFLLSCCIGAIAAWRVRPGGVPFMTANILILSAGIVSGALTVAAEAGSAAARNLGLLALLLAGAAFISASATAMRIARPRSAKTQL